MPFASRYQPKFPGALIKTTTTTLYDEPGVEKLERVNIIRFEEAALVHVGTWRNENKWEWKYELPTPPLTAAEAIVGGGEAFKEPWPASRILNELGSIQAIINDTSYTVFDSKMAEATTSVVFSIPPKSTIQLYRKKYIVIINMFFQLYVSGEDPVSIRGDKCLCSKALVSDRLEVNTSEFFTTEETLSEDEPDHIKVTPIRDYECFPGVMLKDCSSRCRRELEILGAKAAH